MADTLWAPIRTLSLSHGSTAHRYRALQQTGVMRVYVGEHLSQRDIVGRRQMKVMVANRTEEISPSGMTTEASGTVWPWWNWDPTSQPKGRGWKPSAYRFTRSRSIHTDSGR
jgi:hypothetical protein